MASRKTRTSPSEENNSELPNGYLWKPERGTRNGSKVRAARYISSPYAQGVFIHWTGLAQKSVRCRFQRRTEAKHTYLFTKVACIACFSVFPRVVRGQRSRAYLMSFNEKIRRAFIYRRHRTPAFCWSIETENNIPLSSTTDWSAVCWSSLNMHVTFDLYRLEGRH